MYILYLSYVYNKFASRSFSVLASGCRSFPFIPAAKIPAGGIVSVRALQRRFSNLLARAARAAIGLLYSTFWVGGHCLFLSGKGTSVARCSRSFYLCLLKRLSYFGVSTYMLLDCLGVRLELYLSGVYVYRADSLLAP